MDVVTERGIETVTVMSSSQVGKTEVLNNVVGYYIDQDPSPILFIQPTLEMGMAWSKDRFAPMLRDMPDLGGKVSEIKSRDSSNTILHKTFPFGHITIAGANSPASLASRPIRVVLFDEVDKYPPSAGTEGDPVKLGTKRTQTFWNRKIILTSTPTVKGVSRIEQSFAESDQRFYYVHCPSCGLPQKLRWANVKFDKENPRDVGIECEGCDYLFRESDKSRLVRGGKWVREKPEVERHAGFFINELYSPWSSWQKVVEEFLESKKRPETLRVWVNTTLGETWEEETSLEIGEGVLQARREGYEKIPNEVLVLTAGVDIQEDRIEAKVTGWGLNDESWFVKKSVFHGSTELWSTFRLLDDFLKTPIEREDGRLMRIESVGIDSGFRTMKVYEYVRKNHRRRFFAMKGFAGRGKPRIGKVGYNNKFRARFVPIGVDEAKRTIYDRLLIEDPGPGYMHFNQDCTDDYFDQLTAEKEITKISRGHQTKVWVLREGRRNEMLDCEVLSLCAFELLNANMERIAKRIEADKTREEKREEEEVPKDLDLVPSSKGYKPPRKGGTFATNWR